MKTVSISELCSIDFDFEIRDVFPEGWIQRTEFSLYKTKARPYGALFFVRTDINVSFITENGTTVKAERGDVVFIPQGSLYSVHVCGKTGMKIDTYTVNFRLFDKCGEDIVLYDSITVLANMQDNMLEVRLKNLFDTFYRSDGNGARNIAKAKGEFFLLLDLIAEATSRGMDFYYPIRRGVEVFSEEWSLNEKIEKYAQLCGVSETYFYRCFRKWCGVSPVEYRNALRLANAEIMLRCTDMRISEIAEAVGFDDAFYFCRIFSAKFGLSPTNYRKRMQI